MRNAPFHAFTFSVGGGDNVDTLFPKPCLRATDAWREAALGRGGGILQIKTSDAPEVPAPLFSLFRTPWARELPRAPWGWHMAPSLPKKKTASPFKSAPGVPELGREGISRGIASFPTRRRSPPYLSPPHLRHPLSWCSSRWVGSSAQSCASLRKRPSSRQMKYGASEPLETICFQ